MFSSGGSNKNSCPEAINRGFSNHMEIHVPKLQEKFSVTFGQAFSSDITGDGPGSGKPLQLASIRDIGLDQPHKKVLVAGTNNSDGRPRNGRNKKVDFQKPKSGGRSNPDDFSERTVGDIGEGNKTLDTKSKHPAEVREEKRKAKQAMEKKLYLVQPADLPVIGKTILAPGWDGENAYTFSHEIGGRVIAINNITGKIVETVPHGITVKHVCRSAPGYVAVYGENHPDFGDGVDVKPVSATSTECVDLEFTLNGVVWEPARYRVFNPLLTYLRSKISTPNVSESQRHMILAVANRQYPSISDSIYVCETVSYYIHYNECRKWRLITGHGRVTRLEADKILDSEMVKYGEIDAGDVVRTHNSIDCPVPESYECRTDCWLMFKNADPKLDCMYCANSVNSFNKDEPQSYPHFLTSEPGAMGDRYYKSTYIGFYPQDASPFLTYSVNATNACKALKRMCASRESVGYENQLSSMQYTAFGHILFRDEGSNWVYAKQAHTLNADGRLEHTWREKFLKVGRMNYKEADRDGRPFIGVCVGDSEKLRNRYPNYVTQGESFKNNFYPNPFDLEEEGFLFNTPQKLMEQGDLYAKFHREYSMHKIYERMFSGFNILLENFNRGVLDQYQDSHPDWIYSRNYNNFTTFLSLKDSREELGIIPHVKRAIRSMFVNSQVVHTDADNMTRFVEAKVKKEFAKQGKVPRLYVTYDAGCMYANELPEYAKICLDGPRSFEAGGINFIVHIFAKPSTGGLQEALNSVIDYTSRNNHVYILIYSDDSVWSGNVNGVPFAFNVDISSCDSGNKGGVFGLIFMLLSQFSPELALGLVSQCANPIKLRNPENEQENCEINMATFFEGSGTVLTTILNHVAMYMISMAAIEIFSTKFSSISHWENIKDLISESGQAFGHSLSVEAASGPSGFMPEKIQFLKRSPLRLVDGRYVPVMNYGCIFRSFGSVDGDLTADMVGMSAIEFSLLPLSKRSDLFLSGVVAGLVHEPNSVVLEALRRRFCLLPGSLCPGGWADLPHDKFALKSANVLGDSLLNLGEMRIETESICRRYDVSVVQLEALAGKIAACRVGMLYPDEAVGAFARTDYGCSYS